MNETQMLFSQTNYFSKLITDYISGVDSVVPFYEYALSPDKIEQIIEAKQAENIDRDVLSDTIAKQYKTIDFLSKHVEKNIETIKETNTFCIVTAHQLNIFGGPLYLIYKIAQTISTCNQLAQKYPSYNFVPVYWLGSEDHDFDEINHIQLFNKNIYWNDKQGGATGQYSTQSIVTAIAELKQILGNGEHALQLLNIFETAYQQQNLADATRYLMHKLFGAYGLLIIDGNDKIFKQQFIPEMQDDLLHQTPYKLVLEQNNKLETAGYKQQAFPRAINLFYLSKNIRERIEWNTTDNLYQVLNTTITFTKDEIIHELNTYPERFSPNVILRPLYQQKILPALAYIGGAGELSYWLQLKSLFTHYKIAYPQLLLRNSALLVNASIYKKIEKLKLNITDFFLQVDLLKMNFISNNSNEDIDVSKYKEEIETTFEKLKILTADIDGSLINTIGAELQKSLQSIDTIHKKLVKSLKQKNETELNQIEKIKTQLFPQNTLQERVENFSGYYSIYGISFIDDLINSFDVYVKQFLLIQLS